MNKIIVTVGISNSGKSTWATQFIRENPDYVRVNRDSIREELCGKIGQEYYQSDRLELEKIIGTILDEQIRLLLSKGLNVIVDNTHLAKKYIMAYFENYQLEAEIELKFFDIDLNEAIRRVRLRDGQDIDTTYLEKQYKEYQKIRLYTQEWFEFHSYKLKPFKLDKSLPKCIIVDIDGTVADYHGVRGVYDGDECHKDKVIEETRHIVRAMRGNWLKRIFKPVKIIYLSGREHKWWGKTYKWLKDNNFPNGNLYMRTTGDQRADWKAKYELFKGRIEGKYYPLFAIDDRKSIKRLWNKCGLFVVDVNQKDLIF